MLRRWALSRLCASEADTWPHSRIRFAGCFVLGSTMLCTLMWDCLLGSCCVRRCWNGFRPASRTVHNSDDLHPNSLLRNALQRPMRGACQRYATSGLACSEEAARFLLFGPEWRSDARFRVFHCGINLRPIRTASREISEGIWNSCRCPRRGTCGPFRAPKEPGLFAASRPRDPESTTRCTVPGGGWPVASPGRGDGAGNMAWK